MSEEDVMPWGGGQPPHGWVCHFCGKVINGTVPCPKGAHGLHVRSHAETAKWHRIIEEIAAVSATRESSRGQFVVKLDLDAGLFAGDYRDRDLQISAVLREVADRMMRGQYSPDERNRLTRNWDERIGSFRFKEGT